MRFAQPLFLLGTLIAVAVGGMLILGAFLHQRAVRLFGEPERVQELVTFRAGSRRALKGVLLVLALAVAFLALAEPQYGRGTRLIPATDLDVVLVIDFSKSMYARDVSPSRIERAKAEVGRLIEELPGARFGAVAFAGDGIAFPLSSDGAAIAQFFRQLTPNDLPGGTAIARALEAGRDLLARDPLSKDHRRVLVLVTDGEDLEGNPLEVAQAAHQDGVSIDVVQIGGRTPEPIPEIDESGQAHGNRMDDSGQPIMTSLSVEGEEQLTKLAEAGGGVIVRSEKGQTGIEQITARLRHLMTEELSERVETVYADVFAYPLALAVLLLLIETFIPEGPRRARALVVPLAAPKRARKRGAKRAASAAAAGISGALLVSLLGTGCEQTDKAFERDAPSVNQAIEALDAGDAGAAADLLQQYLMTGKCKAGQIGTPEPVHTHPNAAYDLSLGLFKIAESFGERFGEEMLKGDAGLTPQQEALKASRTEQAQCAELIVRAIAGDANLPLDLRARAFYLAGNLAFLREDYRSAVAAYDAALKITPGLDSDAGDDLGKDAAYNRAIALRRIEDQEKDAGADGGEPPDAGNDGGPPDAGQDSGPQEPDAGPKDQRPDAGPPDQPDAGSDGGQSPKPEPSNDPEQNQPQEPEQQQAQKQKPPPSQDDHILDQLERAPTLQQEVNGQRRPGAARGADDR